MSNWPALGYGTTSIDDSPTFVPDMTITNLKVASIQAIGDTPMVIDGKGGVLYLRGADGTAQFAVGEGGAYIEVTGTLVEP
jgi:hypothetical protein